MPDKVLVTGAAGFVGHHFVDYILERTDWNIVCPISCRHKGESLNIQHLLGPRVKALFHDLNWPFSERLIDHIGPVNYIVHLAAESHVERSIKDPVPFIQNNVNVTLNILEYARVVKPKALVQISTDEVYGPSGPHVNHVEWSSIKPSNPYSASKACQEAIAFSYWRTYSAPVIVSSTMNNFGPRQHVEKLIPYIVTNIASGKRFFIHGQRGTYSSRKWTYVKNHADAILFLLKRGPLIYPEHTEHERVNVIGDVEVNSLEMVRRVERILDKKADWYEVDYHTTRPGHDLRYSLDGSKLANMGWKPPYDFEQALQETVLSYLD